jgi:hypothetical protein
MLQVQERKVLKNCVNIDITDWIVCVPCLLSKKKPQQSSGEHMHTFEYIFTNKIMFYKVFLFF